MRYLALLSIGLIAGCVGSEPPTPVASLLEMQQDMAEATSAMGQREVQYLSGIVTSAGRPFPH
jgi:hypothetical protein